MKFRTGRGGARFDRRSAVDASSCAFVHLELVESDDSVVKATQCDGHDLSRQSTTSRVCVKVVFVSLATTTGLGNERG